MTPALTLTPLDPGDARTVSEWLALLECHAGKTEHAAPVCRIDQQGSLEFPPPSTTLDDWVLQQDGRVVGSLRLAVVEGRDAVRVDELLVHPDSRRSGLGRRLLAHALERATVHGRSRVEGMVPASLDDAVETAATAFGRAVGADRLDRPAGLRQVYEGVQDRLVPDAAAPDGYEFVRWGTVAPEQYAGAISVLETTLGSGAPDAGADASYARRFETMRVGRGRRAFHTGVVHLASGHLVGYTSISMTSTQPAHALQGMTVVHEDHRGLGLGLLLKESNLQHVRSVETQLHVVETTNDETNTAMVAVNAALGYVPVERRVHLGSQA